MARRSGFGRRSAFGAVSSNMLMIGGIGIAIIAVVIFLTMSSGPKKPSVPLFDDKPLDDDEPPVVAPPVVAKPVVAKPVVAPPVVAKQVAPSPILSSPGLMVDSKQGASVKVDTKAQAQAQAQASKPTSKAQNLKQKLSKF